MLFQNILVLYSNFDKTTPERMIFAARFESARFEKSTLVTDTQSLIK